MDCLCVQMSKNLSNHNRVFNTGNDSDITSTLITGSDIYESASAPGLWQTVKESPINTLIEKPDFIKF